MLEKKIETQVFNISSLKNIKEEFINLCLENDIIKFGEFTLKSGRVSPYFYNFGSFDSGYAISKLGQLYAALIINKNIDYDVIFAPAYKGIPLAIATVISLQEDFGINKPYCFNRKTPKDHGEKGELIGANLKWKKVLVLDDVITSGVSIENSIKLIESYGGKVTGSVISLNRQEQYSETIDKSSISMIEDKHNIDVYQLANLNDLIDYIAKSEKYKQHLYKISEYKENYCSY